MWPAKRLTATCDIHRKPARAFGESPVVPRSTAEDPGGPAFRPVKLEHLNFAADASQFRTRAPRQRHFFSQLPPGPEAQRSYLDTPRGPETPDSSNILRRDLVEEAPLPDIHAAIKKVSFEEPDEDESFKGGLRAEGDLLATTRRFDAPLEYSTELASRLRWKQVLQAYYFLDPWDKGYIDLDEACKRLSNLQASDEELAEFLLQILEDTVPLISSRGIIEKKSFLKTVKSWVDEDYATPGPYILLRSAVNPVNKACRKGFFPTYLAEKFFEGTYIPHGIVRATPLDQSWEYLDSQSPGNRSPKTLTLHGELSRQRKCRTVRKHQLDKARKDAENNTFKPLTTKYRPQFSSASKSEQVKTDAPSHGLNTEIFYELDDTVTQSLAGCPSAAILRSQDGADPKLPKGDLTVAEIWVKFDGDPRPGVQSKWSQTLRQDPFPVVPGSVAEINSREARSLSEKSCQGRDEALQESLTFNNPYQVAQFPSTSPESLEDDFLLRKQLARPDQSITRARHGDYTSGLKHKSRSTSEWVHELRGGFLPSQIDASTNGSRDRIRMLSSPPGPSHRALNRHSKTPNS